MEAAETDCPSDNSTGYSRRDSMLFSVNLMELPADQEAFAAELVVFALFLIIKSTVARFEILSRTWSINGYEI